jgi:hypothetical protein
MADRDETTEGRGRDRRAFLKLGLTAPAAAAAVAAGTAPSATEAAEPSGETRLQDTAHARTFYASARF